jgi:hypothetical protein
MNKAEEILEELELDLIEFTSSIVEEKKANLPLNTESQIKSLLWNLSNSEKFKSKISFDIFSEIVDILIKRLKEL